MDFYARQAAARNQSRWLVVALAAAIGTVVLVLSWLLLAMMARGNREDGLVLAQSTGDFASSHPGATLFVVLMWGGIILAASAWKSLLLHGGGGTVARSLGGTRVDRGTTDPQLQRLRNVVEEMSIASGVPTPEIWVLENEAGINAFAAGHNPANAAIAVTRGAVTQLRREELQGVIAHEFSHILNGDMRLNIRLMGWLFGLLVIGIIGRAILRLSSGRSPRRGAGGFMLLAIAMLALGYLGLFLGRLIQAAVCRNRERLADASAVQFTRNPDGLKGALLTIAGIGPSSRLVAADGEQVAHMLFAPGMQRLFATHPSLSERILALDPRFNVKDLQQQALRFVSSKPHEDVVTAAAGVAASGVAGIAVAGAAGAALPGIAVIAAEPRRIASQVGNPLTRHVLQAQRQRLALPPGLREFAESASAARALLLALLVSRESAVREGQIQQLAQTLGTPEVPKIVQALALTSTMDPWLRLPAVLQIFPTLRRLSRSEREVLLRLIEQLSRSDSRIDVFEFCLAKLVGVSLRDELGARDPHGIGTLAAASADIAVLFAVVAREGAADDPDARRAYEAGMSLVLPRDRPPFSPPADWPVALDGALNRLAVLHPFAKRALIEGLVATIAHDGELALAESELLRTVCAALQCPLPPLIDSETVQ